MKYVRGFDLDDAIVHKMACSWPSLQLLITENRHVARPKVTLQGLSDLLCGCSQLETLHVSIYMSANDAAVVHDVGVPNMSIRTLDLGYSIAERDVDRVKLGNVFSHLCPNLVYFHVVPKVGNQRAWNFGTRYRFVDDMDDLWMEDDL